MKLLNFPITKIKFNKKNIIISGAVIFLFLTGVYFLTKSNLDLKKFTASIGTLSQESNKNNNLLEQELNKPDAEKVETISPVFKEGKYEVVAEKGEGITHLARKALKEHLNRTGEGSDLTREHKVYIEDYIKDRTGDRWLKLGEKLSFSEELIKEAINSSRQLTNNQLDNLKQFSSLISDI